MDEARRLDDGLAETFDLVYADWPASVARQGEALHGVVSRHLGLGPHDVLDCACGIGTQLLGLAARGHRLTGSDLSPSAVARARREAVARGVAPVALAAADMRALPFPAGRFDAVVCADNSLPHLLGPADVAAALGEMHRVLRPGGLLLVSIRDYESLRRTRPTTTPLHVTSIPAGRAITFQLWTWRPDGERYDLELFQLLPRPGETWTVRRWTASYWALTRPEVSSFLHAAGFDDVRWHEPPDSGFFQPLVTATRR